MSNLTPVRLASRGSMPRSLLPGALLLLAFGCDRATADDQPAAGRFDPMHGSLARDAPQPVYAADPADPWNQVFYLLFTRTVPARLMADDGGGAAGVAPMASGDGRLKLSDRRVTRIESGDRAIDPLYPSWHWMNSRAVDFEPGNHWRVLQEPRYGRLLAALEGVRRTAATRPPLARALMQADLWSAFDLLHTSAQPRPGRPRPGAALEQERRTALLPILAAGIQALALTREEIARLPDNYSAAAAAGALPDLLGGGEGWMEIRWYPARSHDGAAQWRRAARVFFRPFVPPDDEAAFLNRFRDHGGNNLGALDSVALLIQLLLVASDGTAVPSPLTYEAQFRGAVANRPGGTGRPQYQLSRRGLLTSPESGGLVAFDADAPAYLPIAGNDFSFAAPPALDAEPVLAPLGVRCQACHSRAAGVGHLMTFSVRSGPDPPPVLRLLSAQNVHPRDVAAQKMGREDFAALLGHWR